MPNPNDERFEQYLKQFSPLPAERLPPAPRMVPIWSGWMVPATAILLLVLALGVAIFRRSSLVRQMSPQNVVGTGMVTNAPPLTAASANNLLVRAPSFEAALDALAFQRHRSPLPRGKCSALAILSKEDIAL